MRYALCSALLLAGCLSAQAVSPLMNATAEGNSNNVFPFGNTTVPFRFSQVHDDVAARPINGLAFRHNFASTTYPAHTITMDAWMSTAVTTSTTMSTTFDNNHGLDKIQVVTNRAYNHPASIPNVPAAPFILVYPLDVPFVYGAAGSLCWEVQVTAKTQTTSVIHDAHSNSTNPALQIGAFGTGCLATGRTVALRATGTSTMSWPTGTGTLTVNGTNAQANGALLHVIGASSTSFFGVPLPYELPGSNGAPSGSCFLYNSLLLAVSVVATATGTVASPIPVPATPDLNGLTIYSQLWGLLETTNPLGITTSNSVIHHWVAPNPAIGVSRVYLSGSLGPTGSLGAGSSVLVTQFN